MAEIKFKAFVEDSKTTRDGEVFVLKTSEPHRRKNDQDQWETTARTFRDVKASRGVSLAGFSKGDRVEVVGQEKTEVREYDGKKLYTLVVWAESITRDGESPSAASNTQQWADDPGPDTFGGQSDAWGSDDPGLPF